jgi:hypothetical protein
MQDTSGGFTPLYYERALTWYGWQPLSGRACLMPLVGRRHRRNGCVCYSDTFDHARLWTDPARPAGERTVFSFEPYEAVDLDRLRERLAALGGDLQVNELPRSMWWPGTTRLYAVDRPGPANRFVERGGWRGQAALA